MVAQLAPLSDYLEAKGITEADLLADPNRPLILQIGPTRYVDLEDAKSWETGLTIKALYQRSGFPTETDTTTPDTETE
jgi:hypothetical protein